jgi:hypothetical protein
MILQRREFANYLRKNSGVKGDATSSEIQGACSAKLEHTNGHQTRNGESNAGLSR